MESRFKVHLFKKEFLISSLFDSSLSFTDDLLSIPFSLFSFFLSIRFSLIDWLIDYSPSTLDAHAFFHHFSWDGAAFFCWAIDSLDFFVQWQKNTIELKTFFFVEKIEGSVCSLAKFPYHILGLMFIFKLMIKKWQQLKLLIFGKLL